MVSPMFEFRKRKNFERGEYRTHDGQYVTAIRVVKEFTSNRTYVLLEAEVNGFVSMFVVPWSEFDGTIRVDGKTVNKFERVVD